MQSVTFQVPGKPQGKARARTVYNKHLKHSISYTPEGDLLYENLIKTLYMQAAGGIRFEKGTPVALRIVARFEPPNSASKSGISRRYADHIYCCKESLLCCGGAGYYG